MKLTAEAFRRWPNKCITLLGMSGVGKTWLSNLLRQSDWFHYSGDYRIGTRYLDEPILDNIKLQAMQVPFLHDLLRSDSIYINNNITVDHLKSISSFLGMLGNPEMGGLELNEFKRRQRLHHDAEVAAMRDVPAFIEKARKIYEYSHFINDAGGSLCELENPGVMELLAQHTVILYIRTTEQGEREVIERAEQAPKPLYYRETFLDEQLELFLAEKNLHYVAMIDPDEFARWVFSRLFHSRIPRYEAIAEQYGYCVSSNDVATIRDEADFIELLAQAMSAKDGE